MMTKQKVAIKAIEYYLPEKIETNNDLLKDNPEWNLEKIVERTGIKSRRIAADNECASDLGTKAAQKLLNNSPIGIEKIDGLIFCTQSPDFFLPTTACIIQDKLGLNKRTAAFDINLGCSGYIYGLAVGSSLIENNICSNILLICADTYTKYVSKTDRTCRPIFGDAGAATLLAKTKKMGEINSFVLGSDGKGAEQLIVPSGCSRNRDEKPIIKMNGPKVFMFTMSQVPKCVNETLLKSGKSLDEVDSFFFHQATKIVLDNIARHLSIPDKKLFRGYENIGNTVSASIPVALKQADDEKKIKAGSHLLLSGFGVGYSWGSCMIRWEGTGGKV